MRPNAKMAATCHRALQQHADHPEARSLTEAWMLRFARTVNADKVHATIERVNGWFTANESLKAAPGFFGSGDPTAERLAWDLLGGDAGVIWAREAVDSTPVEDQTSMSDTYEQLHREADEREAMVAGGRPLAAVGSSVVEDWASPDLFESLGSRQPDFGGVFVVEGVLTDDNRIIEVGALTHRPLPQTMRTQPADIGAHDGAMAIAAHTAFNRTTAEWVKNATGRTLQEGSVPIWTQGVFGSGAISMVGRQEMADGIKTGVSADLVDVRLRLPDSDEDFERMMAGELPMAIAAAKIAGSTLVDVPAFEDARLQILGDVFTPETDPGALVASGGWLPGLTLRAVSPVQWFALEPEPVKWHAITEFPTGMYPSERQGDHEHHLTEIDPPQITETEPAQDRMPWSTEHLEALIASGSTVRPPSNYFAERDYDAPVPFTVEEPDEHGIRRFHGHLGLKGSCHIGFSDRCVPVPMGLDYDSFQGDKAAGMVRCSDGVSVQAGPIVMATDHAEIRDAHGRPVPAGAAIDHYAHTGCMVGQGRCYEDEHGVQIQGWVFPDVTDSQLARLDAADLSPDWRPRATASGGKGVVAMLTVNVSGFNTALAASAGTGDDAVSVVDWSAAREVASAKVKVLELLEQPVPASLAAVAVSVLPPDQMARRAAVLAVLDVGTGCACSGSCCGSA